MDVLTLGTHYMQIKRKSSGTSGSCSVILTFQMFEKESILHCDFSISTPSNKEPFSSTAVKRHLDQHFRFPVRAFYKTEAP